MSLIQMTIDDILVNNSIRLPDDVFIEYGNSKYTWSYMNELATKTAKIMLEQGIKKGDRVGIYGTNSVSWIITFLSLQKIGAVAVLINSCYKEKELMDCINMTDVKHLFYTYSEDSISVRDTANKLVKNPRMRHLRIYNIEKDYEGWKEVYDRRLLVEKHLPEQPDCEETCCILFTSGTTNNCKGVIHSHKSLVNNANEVARQMRWEKDDKMCLAVPLFHCFGITVSLLSTMCRGGSMVILSRYKTVSVCSTIEKYRCTILNGVPSMFMAMIRNKDFEKYDLSSLRTGIIAGSPIFKNEYIEICSKMPDMRLQPSYGLTEASPCITIADYDDTVEIKSKTAGKLIPDVEMKILELETGRECKVGEIGEIYVKGYNITKGYISVDKVVCDAILPNGCLRTGDLGYIDEGGYLHITGRRKNLIIRGGENISPHEIEEYIKEYKKGLNVYVFGVESEVIQEEIVACIEMEEDLDFVDNLNRYLNENISRYKIPSRYIFIKNFPKNSTGKINEKELRMKSVKIINDEKI